MARHPALTSRARAGYTLTEMMVVVAILGVLALVGPSLMVGLQNFFLMTGARNEVQRDARASLDTINRFLRQASANSIVIDTPSGGAPYSRISFTLPDGRQMTFYQAGNKLMQTVVSPGGATSTSTLSQDLIYIAFTYPRTDDPTIVSVAITMGRNIQLGRRKVLELTIQKVRIMNA
ncbi:MAG: prepilin-type N-terminal cleavage/methylation domain-containing protein [Elusimicrobia bacterium]|nr:prepilin-type N-terminal cleavage/methylation domain-containing protein [Elusimicrobiota bacterium]